MTYLEFLAALHARLEPATYVEIGVRAGDSLSLSKALSVGIDPAFAITRPLGAAAHLARATSDDYFARSDALAPFAGRAIDLALIDGLHRFEFALRDFRYVEAHCRATSVVVFDDVLPREAAEATRLRATESWTGDVWKITPTLARHRPDLVGLLVDTDPTGLLVVLALDPAQRALHQGYEAILEEMVERDPPLPQEVFSRKGALAPAELLASPVWDELRRARERGDTSPLVRERIRASVRADPARSGERDEAAARLAQALEQLRSQLDEVVESRRGLEARLRAVESAMASDRDPDERPELRDRGR